MKDHHVKLTETDREILKSYSTMLEGLSMYLGEGYELVLHSLEDYSSSAVKVIHGLHTGRTEGAPLTDLALDLLEEMQKEDADSRGITYFTHNKKGEPLKSVTIPVRGEKDRIIGVFTDVTKEVKERRKLEYERNYDILTTLMNRRAFSEIMENKLKHPSVMKVAALLMLDLDNLKFITAMDMTGATPI